MSHTLRLMGPPAVLVGEEWQPLVSQRPTLLLLYLATRQVWLERSHLCEMFFPSAHPDAARLSLRQLISRARRLDWATQMEVEGERVRFRPSTDLATYRELLAQSRWSEALEGEGGVLLERMQPPAPLLRWLDLEREALEATRREALYQEVAVLATQPPERVYTHTARRLERFPLHAALLEAHLRSALRLGRHREGLLRAQSYRDRLLREQGQVPGPELSACIRALEAGWPIGCDALRPERLPQVPPLEGRQGPLEWLEGQLHGGVRRLQLCGEAGIGKSALARTLCQREAQRGVLEPWLLEGESLTPEQLGKQLLGGQGAPAAVWRGGEAALLAWLEPRALLLVLDRAPLALDWLERWLEHCPTLHVLIVSREPLPLSGVSTLDLEPLEPAEASQLLAHSLARGGAVGGGAVGLSLAALRASVSGGASPLALELGGCCRVLPASPTLARSLPALLEVCWSTLTPPEQQLLGDLAHFPRGCTRTTAEALGLLPVLLERLTSRALLTALPGRRLGLPPALREFVQGKLDRGQDVGERAALLLERTHFFQGLSALEALEQRLGGESTWSELLEEQSRADEVEGLIRWGLLHRRGREVERGLDALLFGPLFYGLLEAGPGGLERTLLSLLEPPDARLDTLARCSLERVRMRVGVFAAVVAGLPLGREALTSALEGLSALASERDRAQALAWTALLEDDWQALEHSARLLRREPPSPDPDPVRRLGQLVAGCEDAGALPGEPRFVGWQTVLLERCFATRSSALGALEQAHHAHARALEAAESLSSPGAVAWCKLGMGLSHLALGQGYEAQGCFEQALEAARLMVLPPLMLAALEGLERVHALTPLPQPRLERLNRDLDVLERWPLRPPEFGARAAGLRVQA